MLEDIGGSELLGERLLARVEATFRGNEITPSTAFEQTSRMLTEVTTFKQAVDRAVDGLSQLHIGAEVLEPGQFELDVLIPRDAVENSLDGLLSELSKLNHILRAFCELTTGSVTPVAVRNLSSSDFLFSLVPTNVITLAAIAKAINWVLDAYKKVLEIRKLHSEAREKGIPESSLEGLRQHAETLVQTEIERRVPELVHEYARQLAADRRNELETYLKYAMRAIANRIDRGFGFEARAAALPVESEATEDEAPGRQSEERTHIDAVQSVQSDLRYLRPDGPPILSLPESDGQTQDASASQAGEPKPKESKGRKPQ